MAAQGGAYVVKPGDTLAGIAKSNDTTVSVLLWARRHWGIQTLIRVGRKNRPASGHAAAGVRRQPARVVPTAAPQQTVSAPTRVYVVQPGDTLAAVAARFQTTPAYLANLNRQAPNTRLAVGRPLRVPVSEGQAVTLRRYPAVMPTLGAMPFHTVQPGESLAAIAAAYGTSLRRLIKANK